MIGIEFSKSTMLIIVICVCTVLFGVQSVIAETETESSSLRVLYLEFPPYYYTNSNGEPDGFLLKKADELFRHAGFEPEYVSASAKQILLEMHSIEPKYSIGWFKTPQREAFAKFSKPFYQNHPLHVLFLKEHAARFEGKETLRELVFDRTLTLGKVEGYSLGSAIDNLLKEGDAKTQIVVGGYPQVIRILAEDRFDYVLVAPEEIDVLIEKNHLSPAFFQSKELADIPAGNTRHLMFSRGVPDDVLNRLNHSIETLVNW